MRHIALLGSTGSIGRQALDVIAAHPDRFIVVALAANRNIEELARQANALRPAVVSVGSTDLAARCADLLAYRPQILTSGMAGLVTAATQSGADAVLAATDGMAALHAIIAAARAGMHIALANKEVLVGAGRYLCALSRTTGARIIPVDSEHSALFQCLVGEPANAISTVVLTASGGPFWDLEREQLESATPEDALRHPIWSMGVKNTIDSATLMNKGLEVIEASHLFDLSPERIRVVVHRQTIVHGFVVFSDGNVKAQLAAPDMRLPIGYALAYPERLPAPVSMSQTSEAIGLGAQRSTLTFEPVDDRRFPSVRLAYNALSAGGTYPAVLSSANEEAGRAFLQRKIKFTDICPIVAAALAAHPSGADGLEEIEAADHFGRTFARDAIGAAMQR
jgi:1-deoxy-D-xylulose-5-phosphate reductoisomerase